MRESVENDARMRKMCGLHQPIPMNRLDLLPAPPMNSSGIYTRQLKNPQIIQRPVNAGVMVNAVNRLTGRTIGADYLTSLNKTPAPIRIPRYVKNDLDVFAQQTYQDLNSFPNMSNLLYTAIGAQRGVALPSSMYSYLSASLPSVVSVDSGYIPFQQVTPSSSVDTPSVDSGYAPYAESVSSVETPSISSVGSGYETGDEAMASQMTPFPPGGAQFIEDEDDDLKV